jgi:8-oxo-dGTP pyrophosphatase MutT (NUDIX family)
LLTARLRDAGHITGWRNEKFSFWSENSNSNSSLKGEAIQPDPSKPEAFRMERAAFRFFGLHSHAVHINGFTPNGNMWCGRRSLSKSVDPGMLDNLAAGGLPAGESLFDCGVREMAEEAGLPASLAQSALPCAYVETCRAVQEGWHHETLWVYNIVLPDECVPANQDGEVSEFVLLSPSQVVNAIQQNAFTVDASCVIAHAVLHA